ncbi:MAG: outer membrane protein assembly factor BamD [Pseudomonadota bacterium]
MNEWSKRAPRRWIAMALAAVLAGALAGCGGQDATRDRLQAGSPDGILAEAQRQVRLGAYSSAIDLYNALEIRYPFSEQNREGQLGLMYAYKKDRQSEAALEAADKFIRENPRHPRVDYAYYMRGLAFYPEGMGPVERLFRVQNTERPQDDARRAFDNFAVFLNRFEDSQWAPDARQRMIHLRNALAGFELHVAKYYMTRKAYIAAANRAKRVVTEYQGTDAVDDALDVMTKAYRKLGLDDLAQDAERVRQENSRGSN